MSLFLYFLLPRSEVSFLGGFGIAVHRSNALFSVLLTYNYLIWNHLTVLESYLVDEALGLWGIKKNLLFLAGCVVIHIPFTSLHFLTFDFYAISCK